MGKLSLGGVLIALLSLGAANFCPAQWQLYCPEVGRREMDGGSNQFWRVNRDFPHRELKRSSSHRLPISLPEGRMLKPEETNTISGIIKNDFLVNDDATGGCS